MENMFDVIMSGHLPAETQIIQRLEAQLTNKTAGTVCVEETKTRVLKTVCGKLAKVVENYEKRQNAR